MATSSDAASGLVQSSLSVAGDLRGLLQAGADASASGRSVEGTAEADAAITQAVAGLDAPIQIGDQGTLNVLQSAVASASAATVAGPLASATAQFNAIPGSPASGVFGGLIDSSATAVDVTVGSGALLSVSVEEQLAATATNVSGGSEASASLPSADGLLAISAAIGSEGRVQVQVDADLSATASTVGLNASSGDARASASADRVAAITADTPLASLPDPSTLAFGGAGVVQASAGSGSDPVSLSATASSVRTAADATTTSTLVAGISDQGSFSGQMIAGGPLTVTSGASLSQRAVASSVAAAADASGRGDGVFGVQLGSLSSGSTTALDGAAIASVETAASSQAGAATSSASLGFVEGAVLSSTNAAEDASLRGSADASLSARATNVGGASAPVLAEAENSGWVVGLESTSTMTVGGDATLEALGELQAAARAKSVAGEAIAAAATREADVRGFTNVSSFDSISIGGSASLAASAIVSLSAQAQSQVDARAESGGVVSSSLDRLGIVGLELGGLELSVAHDTYMVGRAGLSQAARALSVDGDALAAAISDRTIAVQANSPLSVGGDARVDVSTALSSSAQAATVQGASRSELASATQSALYKDPPPTTPTPMVVGGSLQINATGIAQASSVDAGSAASTAQVDHNFVSAVHLSGAPVTVGTDASLQVAASSSQQARAANVGSASSSGSALSSVAAADQIGALQRINLNVGGDLGPSAFSAQLTAEAQSHNAVASGSSSARAGADPSGSGTLVRGLFEADLNIGGDTGGATPLQSQAGANLRAEAVGLVGPAMAQAGNGAAQLIGIGASDLSIGRRALLRSQAEGQVQAGAESVRDDATAAGQQSAFGWQQSNMNAGESGQMRLLAGLSQTVLARSVLGDSASSVQSSTVAADNAAFAFGSSASLHFDSRSLAQGTSQSVAGAV